MVEAETFNSRDKAPIPMPESSKTFSADQQRILQYERNQIVCYVLSSSHSIVVSITIRSSVMCLLATAS